MKMTPNPAITFLDWFDGCLLRLETLLILILFPTLIFITFLQVICRYVFSYPLPWTEELAIGLFIWVAFIGSSIGVATKGHFGLELVKKHLPRIPAMAAEVVTWLVSASFLFIVARYGVVFVMAPAPSMTTLPISMRWFLAAVPGGAILMLLHLCALASKTLLQLATSEKDVIR